MARVDDNKSFTSLECHAQLEEIYNKLATFPIPPPIELNDLPDSALLSSGLGIHDSAPLLPRFTGLNPSKWISYAERYFNYYKIYGIDRFPYVFNYFYDEAAHWFHLMYSDSQLTEWNDFTHLLVDQFGSQLSAPVALKVFDEMLDGIAHEPNDDVHEFSAEEIIEFQTKSRADVIEPLGVINARTDILDSIFVLDNVKVGLYVVLADHQNEIGMADTTYFYVFDSSVIQHQIVRWLGIGMLVVVHSFPIKPGIINPRDREILINLPHANQTTSNYTLYNQDSNASYVQYKWLKADLPMVDTTPAPKMFYMDKEPEPPDPYTNPTSPPIQSETDLNISVVGVVNGQLYLYKVTILEPIWKFWKGFSVFAGYLLQGAHEWLFDTNPLVITNFEWKPGWLCGSTGFYYKCAIDAIRAPHLVQEIYIVFLIRYYMLPLRVIQIQIIKLIAHRWIASSKHFIKCCHSNTLTYRELVEYWYMEGNISRSESVQIPNWAHTVIIDFKDIEIRKVNLSQHGNHEECAVIFHIKKSNFLFKPGWFADANQRKCKELTVQTSRYSFPIICVISVERELWARIAIPDELIQKMCRINHHIVKLIVELMRIYNTSESLVLFYELLKGLATGAISYSSALSACAIMAAIKKGMGIHGVNKMLDARHMKDVASCNTILMGYGICDALNIAISLFESRKEGKCDQVPRDLTPYLVVFCVYRHEGLSALGGKYLAKLLVHKIELNQIHYACMLYLLCGGLMVLEAAEMINEITMHVYLQIFEALLSGSLGIFLVQERVMKIVQRGATHINLKFDTRLPNMHVKVVCITAAFKLSNLIQPIYILAFNHMLMVMGVHGNVTDDTLDDYGVIKWDLIKDFHKCSQLCAAALVATNSSGQIIEADVHKPLSTCASFLDPGITYFAALYGHKPLELWKPN